MEKTQKKTEDVEIKMDVGKIELPKIDVEKYIGTKEKIMSATIHKGSFGLYLKLLTRTLETFGSGENKTEIKASKILGLQQDINGVWGYGEGTKLDVFLKKYKVDNYKELVGKDVILQSQTSKENNIEFISFN